MILLLFNATSRRVGDFKEAINILKFNNVNVRTEVIVIPTYEAEINITSAILSLAKEATKILLHMQPSIFDISDPYYDYLPYIYALIHSHPSIKNKFYFIHPFYLPSATEFKQIIREKIDAGDFKEIPAQLPYYSKPLPVTWGQVFEMHLTLLDFCKK